MSRKEKILSEAENELARRVMDARISFKKRESEKAAANPELAFAKARLGYIDMCLDRRSLGMGVSAKIKEIAGEKNAQLFSLSTAELEREKAAQEALIQKLSAEYGVSSGAEDDGRYYCPVCKDRGYVTDENGIDRRCTCFKEIFALKIREASGLPEGDFELTAPPAGMYPEKADKERYGISESPAGNAAKMYEFAARFARDTGAASKKLLFITGPVGVGKTHLACCVAEEAIRKCMFVVYSGIVSVLDSLQTRFFNSDEEREAYEEKREFTETADMLIIDDLGVENVTDKRYESLISLIDARSANMLKTVITSNYSLSEIRSIYGERLTSRFADRKNSMNLRLAGDDIRLLKNTVR
ncbi:MAG: ATP-binding protein [Clostridia bacterium]|nr:ATP-binding protein [Clostridia bacterium]